METNNTFQNKIIENPNQHIINMLINEDDISWQTVIYELIKIEKLDPWNIDLRLLTKSYLKMLKKMEEMNFRVSGKVLLAAAILLRIKSYHLLEKELSNFDSILYQQYNEEEYSEEDYSLYPQNFSLDIPEKPSLITRMPKPRERKITVNDLINALESAINTEIKRKKRFRFQEFVKEDYPQKPKINIHSLIEKLFKKLLRVFKSKKRITFFSILPSKRKEDIVLTFIPLLHLANVGKIGLLQNEPFGDIFLTLRSTEANIKKELSAQITPEQYLKLENGAVIMDLEDFVITISSLNQRTYNKHVNKQKNDFADWVQKVLKMKDLADEIRNTKSLEELKKIVSRYY